MIRRHESLLRALMVVGDSAMAVVAVAIASYLRLGPDWAQDWSTLIPAPAMALVIYVVGWVSALALNGLYDVRARWSLRSEVRGVLQSTVTVALVVFALLFLLRLPDVSRLFVLILFPIQAAVTIVSRWALRAAFVAFRQRGRNLRNVLMIGTDPLGIEFAQRLEGHPELGLRIEGFLGTSEGSLPARWPYLGTVDSLEDVLHSRVIDEVAICLPLDAWQLTDDLAGRCEQEGKIVRIPLDISRQAVRRGQLEALDGLPVFSVISGPDRAVALAAKRLLDIVGALAGLVLLSPILVGAAVAIRVRDGSPVFFRQPRAGLNGRPFTILKFRTMRPDADAQRAELRRYNEVSGGASFKMTNDPRITRTGQFLRRTSIDELPQLWNVLKGDMSLVGPRPHPFDDVAGYTPWHRRRLSMKPGMTGLWQIGARRDTDFDRWVRKDLEYIDEWSLWLDVRVILQTIPALLRGEGR